MSRFEEGCGYRRETSHHRLQSATLRSRFQPMPRRVVRHLAMLARAALSAAGAPWALTSGGLSATVADHLQDRYGVTFRVEGRSTLALLPTPRVKFEDVEIAFPHGTAR